MQVPFRDPLDLGPDVLDGPERAPDDPPRHDADDDEEQRDTDEHRDRDRVPRLHDLVDVDSDDDGARGTGGVHRCGRREERTGGERRAHPDRLLGARYRERAESGDVGARRGDVGAVEHLDELLRRGSAWIVTRFGHVHVPIGALDHVVRSFEWTRLEPRVVSAKSYARGLGIVAERDVAGGTEQLELVAVRRCDCGS